METIAACVGWFLAWTNREWYELVPFPVGCMLMLIGMVVRYFAKRAECFSAHNMGYDLFEGITVSTLMIFGFSLFNSKFAIAMLEKVWGLLLASILYLIFFQVQTLVMRWTR